MLQHSPAEYYLKYLISKQEYEVEEIIQIADDYGLCIVDLWYSSPAYEKRELDFHYIEKLKQSMSPFPTPWKVDIRGDTPTCNFLKKQGILDLWFPTPEVKSAFEILSTHTLRADVEQLLLSPLTHEEGVLRLNKHHRVSLTADVMRAYGHYFWNKSLIPIESWIDIFEKHPRSRGQTKAILRLSPDVATSIVPWVLGLSGPPTTLNTGVVARRMRDVAFLKVLEIERYPASLSHSQMMRNYMSVIKDAEEELRQSDVALKDVLKAFERFRLKRDSNLIPSVESVAGLNYSRSTSEGVATDPITELDYQAEEDNEDG